LIYIIDLSITVDQLAKAAAYLGEVVKGGARFFCRKSQTGPECGGRGGDRAIFRQPTMAWGTLTNLQTIRRSVARFREFEERRNTGLRSDEQAGNIGLAARGS
jgi:ribosomal protein S2